MQEKPFSAVEKDVSLRQEQAFIILNKKTEKHDCKSELDSSSQGANKICVE